MDGFTVGEGNTGRLGDGATTQNNVPISVDMTGTLLMLTTL